MALNKNLLIYPIYIHKFEFRKIPSLNRNTTHHKNS